MPSARADLVRHPRFPGAVVALVGATTFAALAWWLVPWEYARSLPVDPTLVGQYFTPDEIARAESYSSRARAWSWSSLAVSMACLTLLATPWARSRFPRVVPGGRWWVRASLLALLVLLIQRLMTLPFVVGGFRLRREYGLTNMSTSHWLADIARSFIVASILMLLIVLVVIGCARRLGRWWSAWAGLLLAGGVLVGSFAYPVLIEPLHNDFVPLAQGELRDAIEEIAADEGVSLDDVVVANASRRTTTLNAWVSGIGPTRRVVLYDNLINGVPLEQVMAVVAHELAHARNGDVVIGTALGAAGATVAIGVLALALPRRICSPVGVPLLLLLVVLGAQASSPIQNGISRALERRADAMALEMTQDPDVFIEVQMSLARQSLNDPRPPAITQLWWGTHPTLLERLGQARESSFTRCTGNP